MSAQPGLLHCAETIKGGIASYLRELLPLQRAEWGPGRLWVVVPASQRAELPVPEGVTLLCYADEGGRVGNALRLGWLVLKTVWQQRVGLVHVHSTFAGAVVRPLVRLAAWRTKLVYCAHGWAWDRPMSARARRVVVAVERALARLTDKVVCISAHDLRQAQAVGLRREGLSLVLNGVSAQAPAAQPCAAGWPSGVLRVLYVGRLDKQKGIDVLYRAMAGLQGHSHAVVVGAAVLADEGLGSPPANVSLAGWQGPGQVADLMARAQVLVVPSRWEGFGLVATEGMRAGLAVVASAVGGLAEIVVDGETGHVIAPDQPQALADALRRHDAQAWQAMGQAGRRRFEQLFTMARVHQELMAIYAGLTPALAPSTAEAD
jgi:glycosyltransferase involved in cell wall biosynthesis